MGNTGSASLPYDVGERICSIGGDVAGWAMYEGKRKRDGEPVSVFKFEKTGASPRALELAENFFKRQKTLRHPHILRYLDGLDTASEVVVVTDRVDTLETWLKRQRDSEPDVKTDMAIAWGFYCLLQAVGFVNDDCKLGHGAISLESILVTKGGDWKLGGMFVLGEMNETMGPTKLFRESRDIVPHKYRSPERLENKFQMLTPTGVDVWALGCVLYECFNGPVHGASDFDGPAGKLPANLHKAMKLMRAHSPGDRPSAKRLMTHAGFKQLFRNPMFPILKFLDEYHLKTDTERMPFVQGLNDSLKSLPRETLCYKVFPALRDGITVSPPGPPGAKSGPTRTSPMANVLLVPIIKIGSQFTDEDDIQRMLIPTVINLFECNDRAVRVVLLENLKSFFEFVDEKIVNAKVFPAVCTGFKDSTPFLRELTVKSMVILSPKLDSKNLNEVLLRNLVTLIKDPEPAIRTNTLVCLGKVLPNLTKDTMKKVALGTFPQAMRDAFPPARLAAMRGLSQSIQYIEDDPSALAGKVIPCLGFALIDPSMTMRNEAFAVMDKVLLQLRERSVKAAEQQKKDEEANRLKDLEMRRSGEIRPGTGAAGSAKMGSDTSTAAETANSTTAAGSKYFSAAAGWAVGSLAKSWTNGGESSKASPAAPPPSSLGTTASSEPKQSQPSGMSISSMPMQPSPTPMIPAKTTPPSPSGWGDSNELDLGDDFGDDGEWGSALSTNKPAKLLKPPTKIGASSSTSASSEERKLAAAKKRQEARERLAQRRTASKPIAAVKKSTAETSDDWEDW